MLILIVTLDCSDKQTNTEKIGANDRSAIEIGKVKEINRQPLGDKHHNIHIAVRTRWYTII